MSISYNSLTGIEGSPVSYISDLAIKGRDKLDSSSATTRIVILLAFVVVTILYYVLFSSLGKGNGGGGGSLGDSPGSGSGSGEAPGKRTLEVKVSLSMINKEIPLLICMKHSQRMNIQRFSPMISLVIPK